MRDIYRLPTISNLDPYGLTLANGTDATNDIDIAAGSVADLTTGYVMTLTSTLTKQLDAAWAEGTNAGGRDTGAIADGSWHLFLIAKPDGSPADAVFSTSATSPTMPAGYAHKRRIGTMHRTSGALLTFLQQGNFFMRNPPILSVVSQTWDDAGGYLVTTHIPMGLKFLAIVRVTFTTAGTVLCRVMSPDEPDVAVFGLNIWEAMSTVGQPMATFYGAVRTNLTGQIKIRTSASTGATGQVQTCGWIDDWRR